MRYKKLPKGTSSLTVAGILAIGGCLGFGITITGFIAIYGFIGLFGAYFYSSSGITLTTHEAWFLATLTVMAAITSVMLSFLAYDMNILSKKALGLSKRVIVPIFLTTLLVSYQVTFVPRTDQLSTIWLAMTWLVVPLCGVLPAWFLSTKAARKVHSR